MVISLYSHNDSTNLLIPVLHMRRDVINTLSTGWSYVRLWPMFSALSPLAFTIGLPPCICGGDAESWKARRHSPICTTTQHHPESPDPALFFSTGLPDYIHMGWLWAWSPDRLTSESVATSQLSWLTSSRNSLLSPSWVLGPLLRVRRETSTKVAFHLGAHRVMGRCDTGIHTIRPASAVTKVHSQAWVPAYSGQVLLNMCLWETAPRSNRVLQSRYIEYDLYFLWVLQRPFHFKIWRKRWILGSKNLSLYI